MTTRYPVTTNLSVPTAGDLPPEYVDGALAVARDSDTVYVFDGATGVWVVASASAVLTSASVSDTATIDLSVTLGVLSGVVVDGSIGTAKLADGGVTNAKIATGIDGAKLTDGTVTNAKIATGVDGAKLTDGTVTNAKVAAGIDAVKLADGSVTNTEFQRLDGVIGNIQTQLDGKQATGNYITGLTGEVTATGPGSVAATVSNAAVIGKVITGYMSGAGTVAATDTILQAIQKLNGNDALRQPLDTGLTNLAALTGTGVVCSTATDTYALRSMATGSATELTITNPAGVAGNPTYTVTNLRAANGTNASYCAVDQTSTTTPATAANLQSSTVTLTTEDYEFTVEVGIGSGLRQAMKCFATYASAGISAVSDPSGLFRPTNSGTGIAITKSANSNVLTFVNRTGSSTQIRVLLQNTGVSAATAWA